MPFFPAVITPWLTALVDFLFFPALTVFLAIPLVRSGQRRNLFFIPLLGAFDVDNRDIHVDNRDILLFLAEVGALDRSLLTGG
jgi:uncharacterized protein involved in response to NO